MSKMWRARFVTLLLIAGSALLAHLFGKLQIVKVIDLKLSDLQFVMRGEVPKPQNIVLVTIDEAALAEFPEPQLFWHRYYARAIRAAADAGAKVLALDVAFAVSVDDRRPQQSDDGECDAQRDHDCVLAEAFDYARAKMPVVCAIVPALLNNPQARKVPINMMAMSDGLAAYANLTVDSDDFVRRQKLLSRDSPNCAENLRSLALRTAEVYLDGETQCHGTDLLLAAATVPTLVHGGRYKSGPSGPADTILINYPGPPGTFDRISLATFLKAAAASDFASLRKWVDGKAVLLGPDTEYDRHATPYYTTFGGEANGDAGTGETVRWNTAGIEIHASTLNTLLTRNYLVPAPRWLSGTATVVASAGTVMLAQALRPMFFAPLLPVWMVVLVLLTNVAFQRGYVVSMLPLLSAALIATLLTIIERYVWAEHRRDLFRSAVDVFVGRKFGRSLEETGQLGLTGSQQVVTILLSDIRGFTSFCESRTPQEVVGLLNEYLGQMVRIIVSHRGSVNKFLGDGILVVFSDDDGTTPGDHASRAVRCGLEMITAPSRFTTGVGIHTGPVVIGNVGSAEKLEYTVLGETVNVASRLEGLNKPMQTRIIFSEDTSQLLQDTSNLHALGEVPVRGLSAPLRLYTLSEVYPAAAGAATT